MRLNALAVLCVLAAATPVTHAETVPDPLFGEDPHARAVLDCHADYARRFARAAVMKVQATPTEIATAACAHCIGQFSDFVQSTAERARSSDVPTIYMSPEAYQRDQIERMREYSFAHTLDVYLANTTSF